MGDAATSAATSSATTTSNHDGQQQTQYIYSEHPHHHHVLPGSSSNGGPGPATGYYLTHAPPPPPGTSAHFHAHHAHHASSNGVGEGASDEDDNDHENDNSNDDQNRAGGSHSVSPTPHGHSQRGGIVPVGQERTLADLKDCPPGVKPYHAYSTLIRCAIQGSPTGKLLLEDIYEALMARFDYFKTAPPGWKNSVRHNLSLNPMFVKVERPLTDRGKGFYWTVRDEEGLDARTGVHRNRKKKTSGNNMIGGSRAARAAVMPYPPPAPPVGFSEEEMTDDSGAAALQAFHPYPRDQIIPDVNENGEVDWQARWWNEINKLQSYTAAHEKNGTGPEWYR
ncbi:hypothetical protein FRC03_002101 [Tulasnella sp. 419]|nr:hypothetical protein FRC03_002101 [Tulasnella sp. 419]